MADTLDEISREIHLYSGGSAPIELCRRWVRDSFRDVLRGRFWSWALTHDQFVFPTAIDTGTATLTSGSAIVAGDGTVWGADVVGRQFKAINHVFTIASRESDTGLTLDRIWPLATQSGVTYRIVQAYVLAPADFKAFYAIRDEQNGWRIRHGPTAKDLDRLDPQRSSNGQPRIVASRGWRGDRPEFEVWPHPDRVQGLSYLYWKIPPDITDDDPMPERVDGSVVKARSLWRLHRWPGTATNPNPSYNFHQANVALGEYVDGVEQMAKDDQEITLTNLWYEPTEGLSYPIDSRFLQRFAV